MAQEDHPAYAARANTTSRGLDVTPAELMKKCVEAWGQADLRPLIDVLDENIVWKSAFGAHVGKLRFGGEYNGRANVIALLSTLSTSFYFTGYKAKEIVESGSIVWGLFDAVGTYAPQGMPEHKRRRLSFETAIRWRVRNGKIVEAQNFFDTAALLALATAPDKK